MASVFYILFGVLAFKGSPFWTYLISLQLVVSACTATQTFLLVHHSAILYGPFDQSEDLSFIITAHKQTPTGNKTESGIVISCVISLRPKHLLIRT